MGRCCHELRKLSLFVVGMALIGTLFLSQTACSAEKGNMEINESDSDLARAKRAFEDYVERAHGINLGKAEVIERPELHAAPFFGFVAVQEGEDKYVRGLATSDLVLTYRTPDAFPQFLAAVDFFHTETISAVQFVDIYGSLQEPVSNPFGEASWPILYQEQLDSAPVSHVSEPLALPEIERRDGLKVVRVWYAFEPGSRYELWTFTVKTDNTFSLEKRPIQYQE